MKDIIEHNGTITSIDGNRIRVSIINVAACAECKAKSLCTSSESKEKYIDVIESDASSRRTIGEAVTVCGSLSMGKKAVRLAFGFPLLILLSTGFVSLAVLHLSEPLTLVAMFALTGIYYVAMYANRDKFSRDFTFWIK